MTFSNDAASLSNQLPIDVDLSKDPEKLREEVTELLRLFAVAVNSKEGGLYIPEEKITNQQYFNDADPGAQYKLEGWFQADANLWRSDKS